MSSCLFVRFGLENGEGKNAEKKQMLHIIMYFELNRTQKKLLAKTKDTIVRGRWSVSALAQFRNEYTRHEYFLWHCGSKIKCPHPSPSEMDDLECSPRIIILVEFSVGSWAASSNRVCLHSLENSSDVTIKIIEHQTIKWTWTWHTVVNTLRLCWIKWELGFCHFWKNS